MAAVAQRPSLALLTNPVSALSPSMWRGSQTAALKVPAGCASAVVELSIAQAPCCLLLFGLRRAHVLYSAAN